jgi:hypothetical protein
MTTSSTCFLGEEYIGGIILIVDETLENRQTRLDASASDPQFFVS